MKVLVTGGTGFIGNHVVRLCLERGDRVRVMVMPGEDRAPLAGMDVEVVEADLARPDSLRAPVAGVDGIYHLAAIYALWLPDPTLMYRVNVEGTRALMGHAMAAGVGKVVFTSSIAALGVHGDGRPVDESVGFNQWRWANDYVWSKYVSEQEVRALVARGLPAVIVNPAFPFGPGDRAPTPTGEILLNVLRRRLRGWIDGGFSVVDVRDVAACHVLAMDRGRVGEGYLAANSAGNMSFREFVQLAARIGGVRGIPDRRIPAAVLTGAARLMERVADATGRRPLTTEQTVRYGLQKLYYDSARAVRELGMPQTPPETSIGDAIRWFREHRYVR